VSGAKKRNVGVYYLMLWAMISIKENANFSTLLLAFLKAEKYRPKKSKSLPKHDVIKFLQETSDTKNLLTKVRHLYHLHTFTMLR
jgi:hypothetical protein